MKRKKKQYAKYGYMFCAPFVIAFLIFSLYPVIYTVLLSFTDFKGMGKVEFHFLENPLQNFQTILKNPSFRTAFGNTLFLWILNFIPQIGLALLLTAWFTDTRYKIKGAGFFKVMFYMPNIITAATIAILFGAFFGYPMGPVNDIFTTLGWADKPIQFMQNKAVSRGVIIFIQFWMWYGNTMIVLISGVLGINPEIFEAAEVDGASRIQTFFLVTIPNLKTILLFTLVTSLIGGLQMFDIPRLYLNGGPDNSTLTTSLFIYNQAFSGSYLYSRASAASMIMFVVICIASVTMFFIMRDKDEIELAKLVKKQEKEYRKKQKALKKGGTN